MCAWVLGCFYSHISNQIFWRVLTALLDSCVKIKECPFSGVTKSDRIWRKVPESDARSVGTAMSLCSLPMKCKKTLVHNVTDTSAKNAGLVHHINDTDCQHSQCVFTKFIFFIFTNQMIKLTPNFRTLIFNKLDNKTDKLQ